MNLPSYIRQHGVPACEVLFGASKFAVTSWLYGARRPRPETAMEIERRTEGAVTMREIFADSKHGIAP